MNQTQINFSITETNKGIKKALDSANRLNPGWADKAYELFKVYIANSKGNFQTEDFREAIKGQIEEPLTNRAYGGVILKAAHAGLIQKVGHDKVKSVTAHNCFASVWIATGK